jgi:hypothetical protein
MKTGGRIFIIAVLALVVCLSGLPALAQNKPADNMQLLREKIRADKKLFVAEAMQLTEPEQKAFWPVYENYQKELMKLNDRAASMIQDYAKNYDSMTDEKAKKLTDEFLTIQADQQNLRMYYLPQFRKVLPEKKVARYYQLENKISAAVNYELAMNIPLVQ